MRFYGIHSNICAKGSHHFVPSLIVFVFFRYRELHYPDTFCPWVTVVLYSVISREMVLTLTHGDVNNLSLADELRALSNYARALAKFHCSLFTHLLYCHTFPLLLIIKFDFEFDLMKYSFTPEKVALNFKYTMGNRITIGLYNCRIQNGCQCL